MSAVLVQLLAYYITRLVSLHSVLTRTEYPSQGSCFWQKALWCGTSWPSRFYRIRASFPTLETRNAGKTFYNMRCLLGNRPQGMVCACIRMSATDSGSILETFWRGERQVCIHFQHNPVVKELWVGATTSTHTENVPNKKKKRHLDGQLLKW